MVFFVFLIAMYGLFSLIQKLGVPTLEDATLKMRLALAVSLIVVGIDHFLSSHRYIPMIDDFISQPLLVVYVTGVLEILGAIGLLVDRTRKRAALSLALYFVCVLPANINNAINGLQVPGVPSSEVYLWFRVFLQPVAIWWALKSGDLWSEKSTADHSRRESWLGDTD